MARILVIEDNAVNLELMSYLLQASGHQVSCAEDGPTGLAMAQLEPPELVLCDIQLPGLDGHGVAAAMRRDPGLCQVPLVAVTAAAMVGDRELALASGFDAHVAKPIDPHTFVGLVEAYLPTPIERPAAAPAAEPSAPAAVVSPELRAPRAGLVLLLVDDKPAHLEFKRDLLEPAGYAVHCTGSAADAWQLLLERPVDIVLSDVVMPGTTGLELLARVRGDRRFRDLPFVFLTSTACDSVSMQQGLALGADDYLMRPIAPEPLLLAIRTALITRARG